MTKCASERDRHTDTREKNMTKTCIYCAIERCRIVERERERERERDIHGWPMLSYLSRFQILDGSPALEHLVSMRKSLIHLPSVPDPLPSLPLDTLLNFLPARLLLHHHPHSLPRTYDFGTQRLDLSRPPYQYFIVITLVATLSTTNAHLVVLVCLCFTSVRFFPLAVAPSGG